MVCTLIGDPYLNRASQIWVGFSVRVLIATLSHKRTNPLL